MRFKRKIPAFVFGVSIGLLVGIAFFIFKIDDYIKKINKPNIESIKIVEQAVSKEEGNEKNNTSNKKKTINIKNSPNINYKEVDALLKEEESINIAQEELLSVKNIKVIDLDGSNFKDTLAEKLAGVSNTELPTTFFVEFWKTPLNSKGYRMARNRVILYGLSDFSSITIYKVDGRFYLKNDDVVYKISSGTDFKPMELIDNADLLARIN